MGQKRGLIAPFLFDENLYDIYCNADHRCYKKNPQTYIKSI